MLYVNFAVKISGVVSRFMASMRIRQRKDGSGYTYVHPRNPGAAGQGNGVDFIEGVATAITPFAFFETVMVKGYESLVDPETRVDVSTGILAAGRLQGLIDSRAGRTIMAEILYKMNRIINAIHDTVPQELWPEIQPRRSAPRRSPSQAAAQSALRAAFRCAGSR